MTASTGETFEHVIHSFISPATKTVIRLVPPAECMGQEEYNELQKKFTDFCEASWKDHRKDPETIDPRLFRPWGERES